MAAWDRAKLGDLVETQKGYAFKSGWYCNAGRPIVKVSDFTDDAVDSTKLMCIPESTATDYLKYELRTGDVVVQTVGSWPTNPASVVGKCVRIPGEAAGALLNQNAVKLTPAGKFDRTFLFYLLRNEDFKTYIISTAQGAASQAAITLEAIRGYEFSLPPLSIQRRIAGILSAYDELIENSQRRIKILESMARGLYREWFVHFRFPGHESVPRVPSPLGEIPKGWEGISFERLLASMTGGDWGSEQPEDRDTEAVMVVRGTDFDEVAYGGHLRAPVRYIKPSSLASRGLRSGDVIIENSINAKSRSVGTTLLVDNHVLNRLGQDAIAASFCKVFRPHDQRLTPLIHLHARHLREDARMEYYQNVAANGIANFQAQKFAKEEHLVLPSNEGERLRLLEPIDAIFKSVAVLASQLANLRRTRDLLLPRLLSGQIDVEAMAP